MSWSIRLFNLAGAEVRIHLTFFLLLAWIAAFYYSQGGVDRAIWGVSFISLLFLSVLLHEFGHVYAARMYGIRTKDVTLLPIGGVAALERMPEKPSQEIVVALAGPAVNLVIAIVLWLAGAQFNLGEIASIQDPQAQREQLRELQSSLLTQVAWANVTLLLFNLIPAFPLDGGRVLRALLALRLGYVRATQTAALIGQIFAVGLGFVGLFGNPLLVLVAVFVFLAAASEANFVQTRDVTRGRRAIDAAVTSFQPLGPMASIDDAAALLLQTTQQEFPVLDGAQRFRGVVTRKSIIDGLREKGGAAAALDIMTQDVPTVLSYEPLEAAMLLLNEKRPPCIGVLDPGDGRLVGYINSENLGELMMLEASRNARLPAKRPTRVV
ncbi:MAG: site-2 protease family protein [Hyphomicrobiales bacterium]|nr:site-2 protease family protein [Hyphomicrobiales bacterium]